MTNREYMIAQLTDDNFIDDGGASWEAMISYNIGCPYDAFDERGHCQPDRIADRDLCISCKSEWLDMEVDE